MIEVKNVNKSFGENQVLKDISTTFEKGKVNLIIGQSGQGKSVLAKCVVGLHEVDSGEILYDGRDFCKMDRLQRKEIRKEIGMLFQGSALFDSLTVEENVMFPLSMFTQMSKKEMQERADFCLERVNLEGKNKLYPSECSGGMQKRIAIARAISMKPRYLFCDEPNSGLDPKTSIVIDGLIKEITYEYDITTVVITHDMNSVIEIGDNVVFINEGQNWWQGTKKSIITTDNEAIIDFVYASEFMKEIKEQMQR
ncbi:MAG: ABC transporter ATP-binding protein [Candidatus Fluviicola riflensis]|nr:MAG: ABC transporter ATP-binding protein [Candidatus Fluviicola riflensis]OGS77421.1 MAG: ABC transporter ATP-binding protein [Candidatus Fluviicola riflensis]OGS84001.1 MAG: ABC transporter ATP-binding protein [Fluviicola sp. RIFCSPHIGHO2_12_FULL_43_24]OGS84488.1 MAG: ABC transporter ATP-binding protein [Fluviicola sp. RIFCSPHIGHO2_01_FULL_43_53]